MSRQELPVTLRKQLRVGDSLSGVGSIGEGNVSKLELHVTSGAVRITVKTLQGKTRYAVFYPGGVLVEVAG